jgi:malonyl-CoA decarboxylase
MSNRTAQKKIKELIDRLGDIGARQEESAERLLKLREQYGSLPADDRVFFFETLLRTFTIPKKTLVPVLQALLTTDEEDPNTWHQRLNDLRRQLEPPLRQIFTQFINLPGGLKALLDFRADLLAAQRHSATHLEILDEEIAYLINVWFQQGFLVLEEITQESSYRQIRFLKDHDLVHPMANLEEMARRLGNDRRCFALFHRALLQEPVVFIEVALTRGLARSIHEILEEAAAPGARTRPPDTAVFYSINNTQNGLAGLGLGKVLIFQVVEALKKDHPAIKTFATLSPLPGFREKYFKLILDGRDESFLLKKERLPDFFPEKIRPALLAEARKIIGTDNGDWLAALGQALGGTQWIEQPSFAALIDKPLTQIAYFYLTQERNNQGKPLNPVAGFHLGNGATVQPHHVHFSANRSPRGLSESCGLMVNYIYSQTWLYQIGRTVKGLLPWRI